MAQAPPRGWRYRFDETNRLVLERPPGGDGPPQPVQVLEGAVTTDRHNRLVYEVERQAGQPPRRIELDGTWDLTAGHELGLTLDASAGPDRQTLWLRGAFVAAGARELAFALRRSAAVDGAKAGRRAETEQRLILRGRWEADAQNRLTFLIEKADGSQDRLIFQSGWTVDRRHQLVYEYRASERARAALHTFRLSGVWDIPGADRLVLRVQASSDSILAFRASLQTPSLSAREGRIIYQVGIGLSTGTTRRQIVLFGTWKLRRDLAVAFELESEGSRRQALIFRATFAADARHRVTAQLVDRRGEPLGLSVTFTKQLLGDAELFVRLQKTGRDAEALAGVRVQF